MQIIKICVTLYYYYEKNGKPCFANLNDLNLSFGSTIIDDELCELRTRTPLACLSIDSIHYDLKENIHLDTLKIQFKYQTDIAHPFQRKSFTTIRICDTKLQTALGSTLQKTKVKAFVEMLLAWKSEVNENKLKSLE